MSQRRDRGLQGRSACIGRVRRPRASDRGRIPEQRARHWQLVTPAPPGRSDLGTLIN